MKTWYVAIVALVLLGWGVAAAPQQPAGTRPVPPGPIRRPLRLLPQGAVFSADGKLLLTGYAVENVPQRPYQAPSLVLWEVDTGKKLWGAEDTQNLEPLGFSADGKTALVRDYNRGHYSLQVWDIDRGKRLSTLAKSRRTIAERRRHPPREARSRPIPCPLMTVATATRQGRSTARLRVPTGVMTARGNSPTVRCVISTAR